VKSCEALRDYNPGRKITAGDRVRISGGFCAGQHGTVVRWLIDTLIIVRVDDGECRSYNPSAVEPLSALERLAEIVDDI
jgi:hypothetical protein